MAAHPTRGKLQSKNTMPETSDLVGFHSMKIGSQVFYYIISKASGEVIGSAVFKGDELAEVTEDAICARAFPKDKYPGTSKAAAALGRIKSDKKAASSRENGKKGGRPRTPQPL